MAEIKVIHKLTSLIISALLHVLGRQVAILGRYFSCYRMAIATLNRYLKIQGSAYMPLLWRVFALTVNSLPLKGNDCLA